MPNRVGSGFEGVFSPTVESGEEVEAQKGHEKDKGQGSRPRVKEEIDQRDRTPQRRESLET